MASIALIPVWSGSLTGCLNITPGAFLSSGISINSPFMGPLPSIGFPSVSTTLPIIFSPTLIEAIFFVLFNLSPSLIFSEEPNKTTPTLSSSKFRTIPSRPESKLTSSPYCALERPYTLAIPSPTSKTVPVSSKDPERFALDSSSLIIDDISDGLIDAIF